MSSKILLWAGLVGCAATITCETIAVAKNSLEMAHTPNLGAISIARIYNRQGTGDRFSSAAQKYQRGDYQGAVADYNRVIKNNPKSANAYYNRGLIKATNLQDYPGALADYSRAIQLKPSYDAAYTNRGNLKTTNLQDYQGALADYNRAIQLKPRNANAYYNRGVLKYTYLKDLAGGIADMQQAVKFAQRQGNPQDAQAASDLLSQWQQTSGN
ncbi:tetratricopeptide repeat protein [Chamaesiphon sp. OTE_8_metabat_110]|uniref:tetratricopeptide repeat protein n=1 Tax=Chamaesiphon sp. OTE_8_metabat_110 TaxID=2964696 RepID=UPI00286A78E9|nr:tetratricopeptide repeat protein [Chamaesiphon sp. OTE_8_metabat_110]